MFEPRTYRNLFRSEGIVFFNCAIGESDLQIGASTKDVRELALLSLSRHRRSVQTYALEHPEFLKSLLPVEAHSDASTIIKRMCQAAKLAKVGPMAAVAGAISEFVGMDLLGYTPEVIVENGGDIFLKTKSETKVAVYAGNSPLSENIALRVPPSPFGLGICTSSGTVGHSLSFGKADAAVVLAQDTALADAAATALGNLAKSAEVIEQAVSFVSQIPGVKGALVILGDKLAVCGDIDLVEI